MKKEVEKVQAEVVRRYKGDESVRQISIDTGLSFSKCRQILISAGLYSSPRADQIKALFSAGMDKESIAAVLGINTKSVEGYLPYTKGIYMSETPTVDAIRIRKCRLRKNEGKQNEKA